MLSTNKKLVTMWSPPHRISDCIANSYKLEMLDSALLEGGFSARWLHEFVSRDGMELAEQQEEFMKRVKEEDVEQRKQEVEVITKMRESDCGPPEEHKQGDDSLGGITEHGLDGIGQGFFYDEDIPEEVEEGDSIVDSGKNAAMLERGTRSRVPGTHSR
jgi:hypothetical protein